MSESPEALAERALKALSEDDPREARKLLMQAVEIAPARADLVNALGVVHLQLGEPELGRPLIQEAIRMAAEEAGRPDRREAALTMVEGFRLGYAAASEDLDDPIAAKEAYEVILADNPGQPRAQQGYAHLLLAMGDIAAGKERLATYVGEDRDEDAFLEGAADFIGQMEKFLKNDIHPREFLNAHRGSYVQFFDHHAAEQEKLGWIAEAARMKRAPDGRVVPMIPEGARPYAAVRVDLVEPRTSQVGQMGDQPMVVALSDYQTLARAPVLFPWKELAFDVRVSSQTPWDQLPLQFLLRTPSGVDALDATIADWYTAGWEGAFGSREAGRLHYISDPIVSREGRGVVYNVDFGRASIEAIDDLLRRLTVLHGEHPIERMIFGRGHLPV